MPEPGLNGVPARHRITTPLDEEIVMPAVRVTVNGIDFTGNPCRVATATWNGRTFSAGERVWAALFRFQAWLDKHHPGLYVYVIQGAYNIGVVLSAGTHDKDGTLDTLILSRRTGRRVWLKGRKWWRQHGWACWWRRTGSWWRPSSWHFHQNLLGTVQAGCPVGIYIPGQNDDYYHHRTGLTGHLLEPGWYPDDIDATIFDFEAWLREMEDDMPAPKDWDKEDWAAVREHLPELLLDAQLNTKTGEKSAEVFRGVTVREALKTLVRPLLAKKADR